MIFNVKDYGAVGDGKQMNTIAIQKAIDACNCAGGGVVLIKDGVYLTGTIILKSNVELHIAAGAVLLGSPNCSDYPERSNVKHVNTPLLPRTRNACMIFAEECENISLTGMGTINCNGDKFVFLREGEARGWKYARIDAPTPPRVVFFTGCKNVKVTDVTMINQPAGWSYWIHDCDFVAFDRVKIDADVNYPNNDGIHVNSSRNVTISNCDISCGDDCLIVRANNVSLAENKVCEKVSITNCNLTSYSGGIRIGWINDGVIRNCTFSNLVMTDTSDGISILLPFVQPWPGLDRAADQGREDTLIENLHFDNIVMDGIYRHAVKIEVSDSSVVRCAGINNLSFSNIRALGLKTLRIKGRKNCIFKNIRFSNCNFEQVGEDVLTNKLHHGSGVGGNNEPVFSIEYAENVSFDNTSFTSKV